MRRPFTVYIVAIGLAELSSRPYNSSLFFHKYIYYYYFFLSKSEKCFISLYAYITPVSVVKRLWFYDNNFIVMASQVETRV